MAVPVGFSPAGLLVSPVATILLTWPVRFQTPTSWDARSCADATTGDASSNASAAAPTSLYVMGASCGWSGTRTPPDRTTKLAMFYIATPSEVEPPRGPLARL